jgi:Ribbon-helix-helix protein, copG family
MAKVNPISKPKGKRIGRPPRPGGRDPVIAVRLPRELLAQVDEWADGIGANRSDAIRRLLEAGLAKKTRQRSP